MYRGVQWDYMEFQYKGLTMPIKCKNCGKVFLKSKSKPNQIFCSIECQKEYYRRGQNPWAGKLPTSTVGEIGELKVAIDLLSREFSVFKALSPATNCDLAVLDNKKKLKTIEVRTGNSIMLRNIKHYKEKWVNADILAIVDYSKNRIIYYPKI